MVKSALGFESSESLGGGDLDLVEFPPLGGGSFSVAVPGFASSSGKDAIGIPSVAVAFEFGPGKDVIAVNHVVPGADMIIDAAAGFGKETNPTIGSGKDWNSLFLNQSLNFIPPKQKEGIVLVQPPNEILAKGAQQWCNALIGNFLGKSPTLSVFQKTADRLLGREGSATIRFLALSVYMINFSSQRVRDWVLESGPWHIQQKAIILRKWRPGLLFDTLKLDSAPVWVKLWNVPLELYSREGLGYIASAVGKPLYMDRATALKQNLEFAKVCIEVSAHDIIPNSVLVDLGEDRLISVVVELVWSPPKCGLCSIFGHLDDHCPKKQVSVACEAVDKQCSVVDVPPDSTSLGGMFGVVEVQQNAAVQPVISTKKADAMVSSLEISENYAVAREELSEVVSGNSGGVGFAEDSSGLVIVALSGDSVVAVESPNKFAILSKTEGQEKLDSPRKVRAATGGVADLMNQIKGKYKGQKQAKKGKGGKKGGGSPL